MIISDSQAKKVAQAVEYLLKRANKPTLGVILGSGLGEFAAELSQSVSIPATDIPNYPASTVPGHSGRLVFGCITDNGRKSAEILVFQGRKHFYETGSLDPVIFPVLLARALGVTSLIVTNAAGGVNRSFTPGDLMLIRDVLNLTFLPLPGKLSDDDIRPSSPALDANMGQAFRESADKMGMTLQEGTYCWLKGPSYETAAEIEMLSRLNVDAVGMSTVPELVHSAALGIRTGGLSLITNFATGITDQKLSHAEVTETASKVKDRFTQLLQSTLLSISQPSQV